MLKNRIIKKLYIKDTMSCKEISDIDGRSCSLIYKILKDQGTEFRTKSQANTIFPNTLLISLYNMGLSTEQIGKLIGVNPSTITKRFKNIGFPARDRKVALAIKYTDEEFNLYFNNVTFKRSINSFLVRSKGC